MEDTPREDARATGPGAALALAAAAILLLGLSDAIGFLSDTAESVFLLTWLLGWVLLAWAVVVGGTSLVGAVRRVLERRRVCRLEWALLSACSALVVLAAATHPPWGSGSGSGG